MRRDSSRTAFDRYPIYGFSNGEAQELPANDWRDFVARHADHKLELLTSTGTNYFPDSSGCDPMSGAYVQVGNGEETLLLRRSRSSIEQPFNYEIVHGRLLQADPSLEIQADAISKKMKLHFSPVPAASLNDDHILPVRALDSRSERAIFVAAFKLTCLRQRCGRFAILACSEHRLARHTALYSTTTSSILSISFSRT